MSQINVANDYQKRLQDPPNTFSIVRFIILSYHVILQSTGIKIDEWKTVVNELLVSDPKKDNSLEYYLQKSRISESGRRFEQSPTLDRLS